MTWVAGCVVLAVTLVFGVSSGVALGASSSALSGLSGSLIIAGSPMQGEQMGAADEARRRSSEAIVARQESRTKFAHLDAMAAAGVANETFPELIRESNGGPPKLSKGQHVTRYLNAHAADIDLGDNENGLIQSLAPMAIPTTHGWSPVDLKLREAAGAYAPESSVAEVRIPKRLSEGVQAPASGLSLTPVSVSGTPLGGSGSLDGATVFFANTQTDADTIIKPSAFGFAVDTVLRSPESPGQLFFKVGLPSGASLVQVKGPGSQVQVVKEGVTIATIPTPTAHDATGVPVPVSIKAVGATVSLDVTLNAGDFQYPIDVDPEFNTTSDKTLNESTWQFKSHGSGFYGVGSGEMWLSHDTEGSADQWAELAYQTTGDSHIYEVNMYIDHIEPTEVTNELLFTSDNVFYLALSNSSGLENSTIIAQEGHIEEAGNRRVCPSSGCSPEYGAEKNAVALGNSLGTYHGGDQVRTNSASVSIAQPKAIHATISYNKGSAELDGTTNVLYGNGSWLSSYTGALQFTANDKGIGVAEKRNEIQNSHGEWQIDGYAEKYLGTGSCRGIQCGESQSETLNYANLQQRGLVSRYENGVHRIRIAADDAMEHTWSSEYGEGEVVLKVDNQPPHGLAVTGLPSGSEGLELGEVPTHVKVEATDGEGSGEGAISSSGVKSIALYVDGKEIGQPAGSCTVAEGACTAHAEWLLNGAELGAGTHTLTIVATDNAYNVEKRTYALNVYPASPVAMGPGSVNPESGDFALGATDVGVSGGTGSLAVSRHYDSLNLKEGEEGPLGPQWSISLGGLASLEVLPDKSVMVVGPEGITHFSLASGGGFEAPAGDSNLTLEAKENDNKEVTEYLLKDAKKGTTTRFTLPSGAKSWMPTASEGPIATDTVTDAYQTDQAVNEYYLPSESYPFGIAAGPDGNVWYTTYTHEIGKITPSGVTTEYPVPSGAEIDAITAGPDGEMWFTASRSIGKITTSGAITEYSLPSGTYPSEIVAGPEGALWFDEWGSGHPKIGRITTSGEIKEYAIPDGVGSYGITIGPDGNLWFTESGEALGRTTVAIGKITPSGEITEYPVLPKGSQPYGIVAGPDKEAALWFAESGTNRIGRITTSGEVKEYSLPSGSEPWGITVGSDNNLWFADKGSSKVGKITTSGVITEYPLPLNSDPYRITAGPDGKMWFAEHGTSKIGTITTSGTIVEPALEIAPHPTLTCGQQQIEKLEIAAKGCRALQFTYAKATTAWGEKQSEWGEYDRRLIKVSFIAYNPSTSAMESKPVAEYSYDKLGRLRAEWNPQASSELKTTYGYDPEGHITALTAPGQQPWMFTYGTIAGDHSTGTLLKATRAQPKSGASEKEIKEKLAELAEPVSNTKAPKITGSPVVVGTRLAVSNGTWSGGPVVYRYQWEDCNAQGEECVPILGATNANYTPTTSDVGHTLIAQVTATSGGGSATSSSTASGIAAEQEVEYSLPEESDPQDITVGPDGNLWYTDFGKIGKITTSGAITEYSLPGKSDAIAITKGPDGNLWYTNYGTNKIGKITTSGAITEYSLPAGSDPEGIDGIVAGPDGNLWYTTYTSKIGKITTSGAITEYSLPKNSKPEGITLGPDGNLWYTDRQSNKIGKITTSGTITEYSLPAGSKPDSIVTGPDENLWYVDSGTSKIGKITTSGTMTEYALSSGDIPNDITTGPGGSLWFTGSTIGKITTAGVVTEYGLRSGSSGVGIVTGPDSNLWYTDRGASANGMIGKFIPFTEGGLVAPGPGSTIEYGVPVSGKGAPHSMTKKEIAKWGQKESETPAYAMAIFPPSEPQGWPASNYTQATITYLDSQARAINTAFPTGGISTREYNEENQVTRSLSADNRAAALKEECNSEKECKSAEVANLLSTTDAYNEEGQLTDSWGPRHMVKLAKGKEGKPEEVLARNHVKYHYNEGAKEAEEKNEESYELVTKTEDAAETTSKEEFDKRVTTSSYSGQEDLGWKLREPTSTTVDPGGLNLTTTTVFQEVVNGEGKKEPTGNVEETRSPGGSDDKAASLDPLLPFGSKGSGNGQFNHPGGTAVDASGDIWVADGGNDRIEKFAPSGAFIGAYGSKGTGAGQFEGSWGIAVNQTTGNVYATDPNNNRVEEFSSAGGFIRAFGFGVGKGEEKFEICTSECRAGKSGAGNGQFKTPTGIAVDPSGNVWVVDNENDRVEEFKENGEYLQKLGGSGSGNGQLNLPEGVAISDGDVYVTDTDNNRVEEFTTSGAYVGQWGGEGDGRGQFNGPLGIAADPVSGDLYVTDRGNSRVEEFSITGGFLIEFGSAGGSESQFEGIAGLAVDPAGEVFVADEYNARVDEWEPVPSTPVYGTQFGNSGSESEKLSGPVGGAVDGHGDLWVTSGTGNKVEEFSASGAYMKTDGSHGSSLGQLAEPVNIVFNPGKDVFFIADMGNNRVDELNEKGEFLETFGYGVSNGEAKLETCTSGCKSGIAGSGPGQLREAGGVAVDAAGNVWVAEYANNRVQEFTEKGEFIAAFGYGVNKEGTSKLETCTSGCTAGIAGSGNGQFNGPADLVFSDGDLFVSELTNNRVQVFGASKEYLGQFGTTGGGNGQFSDPGGMAVDAAGNIYVADMNNNRVQEFTPAGTFLVAFGSHGSGTGQFSTPEGVAINAAGSIYVMDSGNNRVDEWTSATRPGNEGAHDVRTTYYTAGTEAEAPNCRDHPEWTGLPCQTAPKAQPGVSGMPELPVTTVSYNMWDQPEKTEETFGTGASAQTRTKKMTYNAAGGVLTSEVTSSPVNEKEHKELPQIVDTYNKATGVLEEQSAKTLSGTKTITSKYNTLGQLVTYTDADGNAATFEYESEKDDRLLKVSDSKGYQTYHYNETTGLLTELVDSAAGALKAEYDLAGKMTSETYPNAMTATYTYNQVGETTGIEYKKTAHCEKTCPEVWYSDTAVPSIHGETLKQVSTLSEEPNYTYDNAGRLVQAQEIPTGEGCKTREYAYEEEGNRTSETTREPTSEGKCAIEGGSTEAHTYDTANQLSDPGVTYEAFGNTTKMPAADADGNELVSEYYVDSQVAKQEQAGEKIEYKLDPEDRTRETISSGNTASTVITQYDGSGGAVAWTGEGSGETEKWTRNIPGIDGSLTATEAGEGKTGKPAVLLLHDLQGNVVAEAGISETETKLLKKYNSTEFGVPSGKGAPPKYAWLGASGVAGELPSGVITQDGVTYVPQTGRPLQTESVVLPAIVNTPSPLDKPIEEWVGIRTGEGGALLVAAAEQRREEREAAADQPPGVVPSTNPEWCGEEYGPCPEEGEPERGGDGGCSGMNACAASTHKYIPKNTSGGHDGAECEVKASWGEPLLLSGGELSVYAHFVCSRYYPIYFELQVCMEEQISGWDFKQLNCPSKHTSHKWDCTEGKFYRAWAWGRYYEPGGKTLWWEKAFDGYLKQCGEVVDDDGPGPPGV